MKMIEKNPFFFQNYHIFQVLKDCVSNHLKLYFSIFDFRKLNKSIRDYFSFENHFCGSFLMIVRHFGKKTVKFQALRKNEKFRLKFINTD